MKSSLLARGATEAVREYLALNDAIRLASLPGWIVADLTISQLKALVLLEHHGSLAVSELARLLNVGNPAASILVQQLVDQALVERSEDARDRRRTLVRLTGYGAELIGGRRRQTEEKLLRWLVRLSEAEQAGLVRGLSALVQVARAEQEQESAATADEPG
ncbi:MAG TPA: MarR family transcriptional regulator [Anaerolineae bacterium]|nr:MarR family transcriptional regulator [Anaerolineae bacterium]